MSVARLKTNIPATSEVSGFSFAAVAALPTQLITMKESWPMIMVDSAQPATFPVPPRPIPRQPHFGRRPSPKRLTGTIRMIDCSTTPSVVLPAKIQVCAADQFSTVCGLASAWPQIAMKTPIPAIATMLLSTGPHI